jgi:hypothetical protein
MCPDAVDGEDCDAPGGFQNACQNSMDEVCVCGGNDEWNCFGGNMGEGGGGPGGFMTDCGDDPMDGDECDGFGQCEGAQGCFCVQDEVNCQ